MVTGMDGLLTSMIGLLLVAIFVAIAAHRLRLPYTVGLVVTGIVLAFSPFHAHVVLTHDVIFDVILPPLLFEAAINIHWRDLRQDALPILSLAVLGTLIAAVFVAAGMVFALGWPLRSALLFGVLIAATDPVAVIAMFKDNGITGRLRLLVESESLANDGVAAVLFSLVLVWSQTTGNQTATPGDIAQTLLVTVGGGVLSGAVFAAAAIVIAGRTADHLVESSLTVVVAYGSFLMAERLHCSPVLGTVTAGLLMGNLGILADGERSQISRRGREFTLELWDFFAFIANSLVFLLIGLTVAGIAVTKLGDMSLLIIICLVLIGRAVTVYPVCLTFMKSRWRIPFNSQHVLWWGGLRGALGLALALSLDPALQMRDQILVATFGVVVFSVVVQGLTMPLLLRVAAVSERKARTARVSSKSS
jgi:monovalent cation:H+ antiporter, CPA1 family